jgi:hypothetical protein
MERFESAHSLWLFDTERMRYRRLPRGADPDAPSLESDWEPFFALESDDDTGAFTVALNEERTRLIRATRIESASEADTTELSLEVVDIPDD